MKNNYNVENKKYIGCKSWLCKQCKHYVKFLIVSTMQEICWNKGCFFEGEDKTNQAPDADTKSSGD